MKHFLSITLAALAYFASFARVSADVNVFQPFESGNDGDVLTKSMLDAASMGTGTWIVTNFTTGASTANDTRITTSMNGYLLRPITIGGVTNAALSDTRGARVYYTNTQRTFVRYFVPSSGKITMGCYLRMSSGWSTIAFNSQDLIAIIAGGEFLVLNLQNFSTSGTGTNFLQAHTITGTAESFGGSGADTNVFSLYGGAHLDKTYWVSLKYDRNDGANGRGHIWFYDTNTWQRIATSTLANGGGANVTEINFGHYEPHGASQPAGTYVDFSEVTVDTNGTRWPLMPGSYTQLALTGSRADIGTAITNATAGDWVLIPKGSNAWTSGSTLTVTKAVTLAGTTPGATNTTWLTNQFGSDTAPLLSLNNVSLVASNFSILGTNHSAANTDLKGYGIETLTNGIQITHMHFRWLEAAISWNGRGLSQRNTLFDNQRTGRHFSAIPGGAAVWTSDYPLSPTNALSYVVWEDCGVEISANMPAVAGSLSLLSAQEAASYIVRHCNFKLRALNFAPGFDYHGNDPGIPTLRGCLGGQIYSNRFDIGGSATWNGKFVDVRGGVVFVYSNVVTGFDVLDGVYIREEDYPSASIDSATNCVFFANYDGASGTTAMDVNNGTPLALFEGSHYTNVIFSTSYCENRPPYPWMSAQDCSGGTPPDLPLSIGPPKLRLIRLR